MKETLQKQWIISLFFKFSKFIKGNDEVYAIKKKSSQAWYSHHWYHIHFHVSGSQLAMYITMQRVLIKIRCSEKEKRKYTFYLTCSTATCDRDMGPPQWRGPTEQPIVLVHVSILNSAWAGNRTSDLPVWYHAPIPLRHVGAELLFNIRKFLSLKKGLLWSD